jgi:hypothetical protein
MLLAMAVLLIHPQLATSVPLSAQRAAVDSQTSISATTNTQDAEDSLPTATVSMNSDTATQPANESAAILPEAPLPAPASIAAPAPIAFLKPAKPLTVSVADLRAENRRQQLMWKGLVLASSSAATFDAWSTRRAITNYGATELNPLLRPFAGNASLYAAIQVGPALMDFAGKKMMYSKHAWVRHVWWVPQTASYVSSILCGAHNLSYR